MDSFEEPLPLQAAIKIADVGTGQDGWNLIVHWGEHVGLQMNGFVEWPPSWDPGFGTHYVPRAGGYQEFKRDWPCVLRTSWWTASGFGS
jgi:hypothetical protein